MALITPDLLIGFPSFEFWSFFVGHALPILGIVYAAVVLGMRPQAQSILWATLGLFALAVPVGLFNYVFGTNYLFLRHKPLGATAFDYFGPWPWYLVVVGLFGMAMFSLCYLPFLRSRRSTA